jgi:hypothetical protein
MRKSASLFAGVSVLALAAAGCSTGVEQENFTATLNRAQEVVPGTGFSDTDGSATATGSMQLVVDAAIATFTLTVNGLSGITAAHIHTNAAAGVNGPVSVFLFDGPTTGAQNGVLNRSTFNQAQIKAGASGGAETGFDGVVGDIRGHTAYVNVHTTANAGGAIRGNF